MKPRNPTSSATPADPLAALVARAKRLEPEAFEELVDRYTPRLYGLVCRLTGRRGDAEDMVQEVFVRIVRGIGRYEHDGRFEAWIFRIALNLARDRIRQVRRAAPMASSDEDARGEKKSLLGVARIEDESAPPPEGSLELAENVDRLGRALAELPAAEREVIMLRHYSGLSFKEIANMMETPLGTALARAHRGLRKLRTLLESQV